MPIDYFSQPDILFKYLIRTITTTLLCLAAFAPISASAQDHIVERAWLEDPSGKLAYEDVRQQAGTNYSGVLSRGYGHSAIWIRLRIDPSLHPLPAFQPQQLLLRIRPVYLDDIQIFDPMATPARVGVVGDTHPPSGKELRDFDFLVPIARGKEARDIWIRLASTSTRQIDIQALNLHDQSLTSRKQGMMFGIYIGLIAALAGWGIAHGLFNREVLIGAFGLKLVAALAYAFCSLGYLYALWPGDWPVSLLNLATTTFSILGVSSAELFHVLFIREFDPPRWVRRILYGVLALFPIKVAMVVSGLTTEALQVNMSEVLFSPMIFLGASIFCKAWSAEKSGVRTLLPRYLVIGFYSIMVTTLLLAGLPGLGIAEGGEISLYIVQAHGLITTFMVMIILQFRSQIQQQIQRETAISLELAGIQARHERAAREGQEKLLAMLAHEIKTPLATMQLRLETQSANSPAIKQAIRDMNNVIERCVQTTQLSDNRLVPHIEHLDLVSVINEAATLCPQASRLVMALPMRLAIESDRQLLFIVINNLLENAFKYSAPDSQVHLALTMEGGAEAGDFRPVIEIRNRPGAAGMPDPARVFEKFYRSPHARRQAGTGLGLYLANHLMQTLGGHIDYVPDETWVRFVVNLPNLPSAHS